MASQSTIPPKFDPTVAPTTRRWRSLVIGGGALALVLGGYWYYSNASAPRQQVRRETAAPVGVGAVERRDMPVIERTIGTVVANSNVQVTARVQGHLNQAFFKEGQLVKKGQVLFQLDPRPYQAALDRAEANLVASEAKYKRYQSLVNSNAISQQTNDDAHAIYLQAQADVDAARLNLEFTRIVSPVNGKTGAMLVQPGNYVTPTAGGAANAALVNITEIMPIKISFALPQSDLPRIQIRARNNSLTAQVQLHDAGGTDLTAPVDFVNNAVAGNSGTIEMRASVPNADAALVPGQLVDVVVELDVLKNALVIPRDGINNGPNGQFVYLITPDMTAKETPVKVLFDDGTHAAVTGSLEAGDRVVTNGQLRVLPGGKVRITGTRGGRNEGAGNGEGRNGRGRGGEE